MADDELWGSRQGGGLGAGGRALAAGDGAQCSGAWWARCGAGCTGWGGGGCRVESLAHSSCNLHLSLRVLDCVLCCC